MAKVLIVGGGFAAVAAAEVLAARTDGEHDITLISNDHDFTFFPALVPLVFDDFRPEDIHFDLRPKLAERHIRFIEGRVLDVDLDLRVVRVNGADIDGIIRFDYLMLAMGRRLAIEETPGFFKYSHHLLGIGPALKFKKAIADFKTGSIVVGLCPDAFLPVPVCEAALALAEKFRPQILAGEVSVSAVFPGSLENAFAGSALFRDLRREFDRKGITLVTDFSIDRVEERRIISTRSKSIDHDLLMLVPPFRGQAPMEHLAIITDDAGFVRVNDLMQVKGYDRVYAAGDIVALPGPRFGYMAMLQARVAATNIIAQLNGEVPLEEYSHKIAWIIGEKYTDPVFFHYGFWDDTLAEFNDGAFFGMARRIRDLYGPILGQKTAGAAGKDAI